MEKKDKKSGRNGRGLDTIGKRILVLTIAILMTFQFCTPTLTGVSFAEEISDVTEEELNEAPEAVQEETQPQAEAAETVLEQSETAEPVDEVPAVSDVEEQEEPAAPEEVVTEEPTAEEPAAEPTVDEPAEQPAEQPAPEETTEEVKYPAQNFDDTTSLSDVDVHVIAPEGSLPEGTTMTVKNVSFFEMNSVKNAVADEMGSEAKVVKAVDITFFDKDGNEVQPKEGFPVSVSMNSSKFADIDNAAVVHIDDNKKAEVVTEDAAGSSDQEVVFDAEHFSVYVVVETVVPRLAVNFYNYDGTLLETMYVKKADTAADVDKIVHDASPKVTVDKNAGEVFYGWTTSADYTTDAVDSALSIEDVRAAVVSEKDTLTDADKTLNYYAVACRSYFVDYLDDKEITLGSNEIRMLMTDGPNQSYTVNQIYTPSDSTHNFEGWKVSEGGNKIEGHDPSANNGEGTYYLNGTTITISGSVVFSVNAPSGQWLVYDENAPEGKKATYNAPRFLKTGDVTSDPNTEDRPMTCVGYEFGGWFDTKEHANNLNSEEGRFTFGGTITDRTTVYARWIPKTKADYTIVIWKQSVAGVDSQNNKVYDFVKTIKVEDATVGDTINVVSGTSGNQNARVNGENYGWTGFHYDRNDQAALVNGSAKVVEADNSTVVNVYFDRNEYTLTFQAPTRVNNPSTNDQNLYGYVDDIGYVHLTRSGGRWYFSYGGGWYRYSNYGNGYYYHYTSVKTITALYEQNIRGNFPIVGTNGVTYDGASWQSQGSSIFNDEAYISFINDMQAESTTFRLAMNPEHDYYTYHVIYYVEALPEDTETVEFDGKNFVEFKDVEIHYQGDDLISSKSEEFTDLTGFTQYKSNPAYDAEGHADFDSNRTIKLYYTRKVYDLSYFDGAYVTNENVPVTSQVPRTEALKTANGIAYNADMSSYNKGENGTNYYEPDPVEGFVFAGWYLDSACTQPCTFTTMPEGGMSVYAKWVQKEYRVIMHPNAVLDNGEKDTTLDWGGDASLSFKDAEGAKVSLLHGTRQEYELVGWFKDPEFRNPVDDKIALTAETTDSYDKTQDTELDIWGNSTRPGYNKDAAENRFWVVGIMELYAQWRKVLEGADGIGLVYVGNGLDNEGTEVTGTAGADNSKYKDHAKATAIPGATASNANDYRFEYWVVQKWNEEANKYEDTDTHVYAGGSFDVLKDDAKVVVNLWCNPNNPDDTSATKDATHTKVKDATYTVQLRPQYIKIDEKTDTHIDWYSNYGDANGGKGELYYSYNDISINEAVDIIGAKTRANYDFKGWTKTKGGTTADFLIWTGTGYTDAEGNAATQVAADENQPYDDLYAVWEEHEVTINYAVAEDSTGMGTVAPTSETVKVETGTAAGSTATASESKYVIEYWTCDNGTEHVGDTAEFVPSKNASGIYEAHTYYAHFKLNEAPVTVHHYLKGTTTKVADDVTTQQTIGTEIDPGEVDAATSFLSPYDRYTLTKDSTNPTQTVTVTEAGVEITLYYTLPLTIEALTDSKTYDGKPLNGEYTIKGTLPEDGGEEGVVRQALGEAPSITNVSESPLNYLTAEDQAKITGIPGYYVVTYKPGTLTIDPKAVTITAKDASKPYDGTALTESRFTATALEEGDTHTFTVVMTEDSTITNVGDQPNVIATVDGVTVTTGVAKAIGNYTVTTVDGNLHIDQDAKAIEITSASKSWTYNGALHKEESYTVYYGGDPIASDNTGKVFTLRNGDVITITATAAGVTNVSDNADKNNTYTYTIKHGETDTTGNYKSIVANTGTLTINAKAVTIKAEDASKPYDGTALTESGFTATALEEGDTHKFTVVMTADSTITNVGDQPNVIATVDGVAVTTDTPTAVGNYTVTTASGMLHITQDEKAVEITSASKSWTYNGALHKEESYTVYYGEDPIASDMSGKVFTLPNGDVITITATAAGVTNVSDNADKNNTYTYTIKHGETDTSGNYKSVVANTGTLTINPKAVTITAKDANKTYDGDPLTESGFTATDLEEGDTHTFTVVMTEGSTITNVGEKDNVIASVDGVAVTTDTPTAVGNYTVTTANGTLTVKPATMTLTVEDYNKPYDADAHTVTATPSVTEGTKILYSEDGETWKETAPTWTDATTAKTVYVKAENPNYSPVTATGKVTITKLAITVFGAKTETYDGTEKTLTLSAEDANGVLAGETLGFQRTPTVKGTNAGTYDTVDYGAWYVTKADGETDSTDNYTITVTGTLTIDPAAITIKADDKTKVYDNDPLTDPKLTATVTYKPEKGVEPVYSLSREPGQDVGDYVITVTAAEASNPNYTISVEPGTFKITQLGITVTITGNTATETYDGTEKTVTGFDYTVTGAEKSDVTVVLAEGKTAEAKGTDVKTEGDNKYMMGLTKESFAVTATGNYKVDTVIVNDGWLKIDPAEITIKADDNGKVYDNDPETDPKLTATVTDKPEKGADPVYTVTRVEGQDVDTYAITVTAEEASNPNYTISVEPGTFTITPAKITIKADDKNKVYDNDPATDPELTATVTDKPEKGVDPVYTVTRVEGQDVDSYAITVTAAETSNKNYTISVEPGTFKITPAKITIKADDKDKVYDNDPATDPKLTATVSNKPANGVDPVYTVTRVEGQDANTYAITVTVAETSNKNYTISVEAGTFTIKPAEITITADDKTKSYDNDPATDPELTAKVSGKPAKGVDPVYTVTRTPGQDVAKYPITVTAEEASNPNYKINVAGGVFEITPIDVTVTITGHIVSTTYDNKDHTAEGYDVEISNPLYKEADFEFSGTATATRKEVGKTNMNLADDQFTNKNTNFRKVTFNVTDGYVEIVPVNEVVVTIKGNTSTLPYDGKPHTVNGYEVTISNPLYTEDDFTFSGNDTATRTNVVEGTDTDGKTDMGLAADQFVNDNKNFKKVTFNVTDGYQEITPIDVTVDIKGKTSSVDYDGEEHVVSGYDVTISNDLYKEADFTFSGKAEAKRTNVVEGEDTDGKTDMGLNKDQFENKNTNFKTVTFNVTDGYQEIKPIDVTVDIKGKTSSVDYDGEEHKVSGYEVEISNDLYKEADFTFSGKAEAKRTNVVEGEDTDGKTDMGLNKDQFENKNTNFKTVTFNVTDGYQEIKPIDVTVTITEHGDKVDYDGKEHSVSGYDVKIGNELYKEADFTFTGTDTVSGTNAGTYDMELKAADFTNNNKNFDEVTFVIVDGQLVINQIKATVTITGHNSTVTYDNKEHSVSGYDVEIGNPLYKEADFTFNGNATASRTDVGTTNMGLTASQFTNNNKNFSEVTFDVTDGYQTITPIDVVVVKVTGHTDTANYDGAEHTVTGYDVEISNPLYKEADFTFTGKAEAKRTDAGTTNMGLTEKMFANKNDNFASVVFQVTDGYQKIDPIDVTVTITGHNNTANYDGKEHVVTGYDFEASTPLYKEADITFTGKAEAKRTDAGTTNMGLDAEQFANKNTNFKTVTFNVTDGYQTISPIDVTVTITGHNNTAKYDSKEHVVTGYDVEISNPLYKEADFTFSGKAEAKRTEVGTTNMGLAADQFTNKNTNFKTVTFNVTDGYQAISPVDEVVVTITGHSNTAAYDGKEHTVTGYDVSISDPLYKEADFTFTGKAEAKRTDAGTTNMGLAASQFANTNTNFAKVTFNVTDGYQTIDPIDVTVNITGHNNTANYDGKEHSVSGYDVEISNPLYKEADFTFSGKAEAKRTDAGQTNMGLTKDQFENTNTNFKTVTFNVTDGYQKIDPIDVTVTITGHKNTTNYDGKEHVVTGYDVTISDPLYKEADFTFSGKAEAKRTDAGTTNMGLAESQFANTNANFKSVTFNVTDGYQTINPIDVTVTITGHKSTVDYDGKAHTVEGYDFEANTPLYKEADFTFSGKAEATRTDVGTTNMGLAASQFANTNANFKTVTFNVTDGSQTINPIDVTVTITGHKSTVDYDGKAHTVTGYDFEASTPLYKEADFTFSGKAEATRTDAGTTNMGLAASQFANTNANFKTVTFNVTDGSQTINPIDVTVTITGHSNTAVYDGKAHTVTGYDVQIGNPLYTEADFTFSGKAEATRTNVVEGEDTDGQTDMGLAASQFANTNANFKTVTFNVTDGFQKITPVTETVTVKVTGKTETAKYDGKAHSVEGYDVEISNELYTEKDFQFTGNDKASRTQVFEGEEVPSEEVKSGTTNMGMSSEDFKNLSANFENIVFQVTDGYVTIAKRPITFTSEGDQKTYDGTPLTNDTVTITGDGPAPTDEVFFEVTGSQTLVGSSDNTFIYKFAKKAEPTLLGRFLNAIGLADDAYADASTDPESVAIAANYEINEVDGVLAVTDDVKDKDHETVVKKTHTAEGEEEKTYQIGDTIEYTITVTNLYSEPKNITIVEQEGVTITGDSEFKDVPAGEIVTTTATHVVTEDDIKNGSFTNTVKAEFDGGKTFADDDPAPNFAHMTVEKKVINNPADGKVFRTGEKIKYEITVKNDGTTELKDIVVKDELTGDEWKLDSLAAGKTKTYTAEYLVTEKDGANGSVINVATGTGTDPDGDKTPETKGDVTTKTDKALEPTVPKTGDNTPIVEFSVIFGASVITLLMMLFRRRKERV